MPETITENGKVAAADVPALVEPDDEAVLRSEAVEQIRLRRKFKMHLIVVPVITLLVGASWVLTEYYTAHTSHMWPSSFADAPADRPGVWSTWFFYFAGVMVVVLAIDAYRTYARPYVRRSPTKGEIEREVERLKPRR